MLRLQRFEDRTNKKAEGRAGARPSRLGIGLLLSLACVLELAAPAQAQIVRDDTPGQSNTGVLTRDDALVFEILGSDGIRLDGDTLLLHSFTDFNLAEAETALFTEASADMANLSLVEAIITRVTGGKESRLMGGIESLYPNADFVFMNPNGVFFGTNFKLDVPQSFHVSTADELNWDRDVVTPACFLNFSDVFFRNFFSTYNTTILLISGGKRVEKNPLRAYNTRYI